MPQITLTQTQTNRLAEYLRNNDLAEWFIAKDHGAYIGASMGVGQNCIFYFRGCNPNRDTDWYDNTRRAFGGDDFGEHLDAEAVFEIADSGRRLRVELTPRHINLIAVG